jgi:drug/metabolite transporter (DMT)-like permease
VNSIHPKAVGGGLGALLSGAVITVIQTYWLKNELPGQITALIYVAVPGLLAFAGAWLAPERPGEPLAEREDGKSVQPQ